MYSRGLSLSLVAHVKLFYNDPHFASHDNLTTVTSFKKVIAFICGWNKVDKHNIPKDENYYTIYNFPGYSANFL